MQLGQLTGIVPGQDFKVLGLAFGLARDGPACLFHRRQYDARVCWRVGVGVFRASRFA